MFGNESEPFTLHRDVEAVLIPAGQFINLREGTAGYITQSLGGSFTVYVDGSLFRIAGANADALGKEPVAPPAVPDDASDEDIEQVVWSQLRTCFDPEIPVNIADLGLIYRCQITARPDGQRDVDIDMTLTAPGCGMGDILVQDVRDKVAIIPTIHSVQVEMVFDPPWNQMMMTEEARLQLGML